MNKCKREQVIVQDDHLHSAVKCERGGYKVEQCKDCHNKAAPRLHYPCHKCGGTGAGASDEGEWCLHCSRTGKEPSKVDEETLMALWEETATRDDRVLAFGFAVAQHVAMVCRMDGA